MFALFYSLYYAMFIGEWRNFSYAEIFSSPNGIKIGFDYLGKLLTSIFTDITTPYSNFGTDILAYVPQVVAFALALITSIGIVVMAVKGVKKAFGIFFGQIR